MSGARRLTIVLLAGVLCIALKPAAAGEDYPGKPLKSSTGAVFRSLAVPGWGQFYTENYWKAAAFLITEGSLAAGISWNHDQMMRFKKATSDNEFIEQDYFLTEKHHRNQRNVLICWLAGIVLLSMGDAYVDAHLYGLDWSPDISLDHRGVSGGLAVAVRF